MIEQALVDYLNSQVSITSLIGGSKVYYSRAPSKAVMPFITIKNAGGPRKKVTQYYTDADDTVTVYVDASNQFNGRAIAEAIMRALENYRGDMYPAQDVHITLGSIRDLDGFQGTYRFILPVSILYKEITQFPS